MKSKFPGHYRPNSDDLDGLWENCIFTLDANVLLHLYRYTPKTRQGLQSILNQISERLWVPHQAAFEYQVNRLNVIIKQVEAYEEVTDFLEKSFSQIENKLNSYRRHPFIDAQSLLKQLEKTYTKINYDLKSTQEKHPDLIVHDTLRDEITELLNEKVGEPYPEDKLVSVFNDGEKRFNKLIPPGYKDSDQKNSPEKYGDLILWYQIIDKAKIENKPIILVTDDTKEDWWWKFKGRTIGPRPELAEEMLQKANVKFYMYKSDQFMENARKHLKRQVEQNAIDEIRAIRRHEEAKNRLKQAEVELQNVLSKQFQIEEEQKILAEKLMDTKQEISSGAAHIHNLVKDMENISKISSMTSEMLPDEVHRKESYLNALLEKQEYLKKSIMQKESLERHFMDMNHRTKYLAEVQREIMTRRATLEEYLSEVVQNQKIPNKTLHSDG
jgi:hypothetical protein